MSNKKLLVALVVGLQALQGIAETLADEAIDVDEAQEKEKLLEIFGRIKADLAKHKQPDAAPCCPEADAASNNSEKEAAVEDYFYAEKDTAVTSSFDTVMNLLNDDRYTLRSFKSIQEATGLEQEDVCHLLNAEGIEFVVLHNRNGDAVVGLESRN